MVFSSNQQDALAAWTPHRLKLRPDLATTVAEEGKLDVFDFSTFSPGKIDYTEKKTHTKDDVV